MISTCWSSDINSIVLGIFFSDYLWLVADLLARLCLRISSRFADSRVIMVSSKISCKHIFTCWGSLTLDSRNPLTRFSFWKSVCSFELTTQFSTWSFLLPKINTEVLSLAKSSILLSHLGSISKEARQVTSYIRTIASALFIWVDGTEWIFTRP